MLAVGPQGGFSPGEEDQARAAGWHFVRLGTHILRVETAGLAGAATILALAEWSFSAGPLTAAVVLVDRPDESVRIAESELAQPQGWSVGSPERLIIAPWSTQCW